MTTLIIKNLYWTTYSHGT